MKLMQGNYLQFGGQTVIVLDITRRGIECGYFPESVGFFREWSDKYLPQPIPLTEEELVKLGFMKQQYKSWYMESKTISIRAFSEYLIIEIATINAMNTGSVIVPDIQYTHQLQNLVEALTGSELKYI